MKISAENTTGSPIDLALSLSSSEHDGYDMRIPLQAGENIEATYLIRLNDIAGGTNLRLWHNDSVGTADLSGVTIIADITYWLFNITAVN